MFPNFLVSTMLVNVFPKCLLYMGAQERRSPTHKSVVDMHDLGECALIIKTDARRIPGRFRCFARIIRSKRA
jgi:hypothetical protein